MKEEINELAPPTYYPGNPFTDGYPNAYTESQLTAFPKPGSDKDYTLGMTYQYRRIVGSVNSGTDQAPVWNTLYELVNYVCDPQKPSYELAEFRRRLSMGGMFMAGNILSWNVGITTTATNYAASITLNNPISVVIDWGDGTVNTWKTGPATHTYAATGSYTIKITGTMQPNGNIQFKPLTTVLKSTTAISATLMDFTDTFNGTGLTAFPAAIFDNCLSANNFTGTFKSCTAIAGAAPALWTQFPTATSTGCFNGDTQLSNYASIPAGWK